MNIIKSKMELEEEKILSNKHNKDQKYTEFINFLLIIDKDLPKRIINK